MLVLTHPMTGDRYTADDGLVKVERDGKIGYFGPDGAHVRGELLSADPLKLLSMGGNIENFKEVPSHE